jgi:hypothetical protein
MNRNQFLNLRKYAIVAAAVFWLPDIALHAITRYRSGGWLELVSLTILLPALSCIAVGYIWKINGNSGEFLPAGLSGVLGIWLFGPLLMTISFSFSGGGFATSGGWQTALLGTALFPMFTFMMSAYDGTLFGVLIASAVLPLMSHFLKHVPQPAPLPPTK